MRKLLLSGAALLLACSMLFTVACKKNKDEDATPTETTDDSQATQSEQADDEANVQGESDQALDDINQTFSYSGFNKTEPGFTPCGATKTVDTTSKTITLIFNDTIQCVNKKRTRSGQIKVQLVSGTRWRDAGAVLNITFTNYKVSRIIDGKSLTLNGTHTVTNVTGTNLTEIKHKISGSLSLTFDNGTVRTWNVAKIRTLTNTGSNLVLTIAGDATVDGQAGVVAWGTTRKGKTFTTYIEPTNPIKSTSSCLWYPTGGVKVHKVDGKTFKVTFGLSSSGTPVSGTDCATKFKIEGSNKKGESFSVTLNYK